MTKRLTAREARKATEDSIVCLRKTSAKHEALIDNAFRQINEACKRGLSSVRLDFSGFKSMAAHATQYALREQGYYVLTHLQGDECYVLVSWGRVK